MKTPIKLGPKTYNASVKEAAVIALMIIITFKEDFGWVRARVRRCGEENVTVQLVDLGVLELVTNVNSLRILPQELREIPSPAVIVKLNISHAEDIDVNSAKALMKECLVNLQESTFLNVQHSIGFCDEFSPM